MALRECTPKHRPLALTSLVRIDSNTSANSTNEPSGFHSFVPSARAVFLHCRCTIIAVALPDEPPLLSEHVCCSNKLCAFLPLFLSPRPTNWNAVLRMSNGRVKIWTPPAHDLIEMGYFPSLLSCVQLCPAPPVTRTRRFNCLAEAASNLAARPIQSTLIRVRRLNHRLT